MIHLIVREPLAYQRTLCQALSLSFKGAFVAWFTENPTPDARNACGSFSHRFLSEIGFRTLFRELRTDPEATVILGGWSSSFALKTLLISALLRFPVFIWTDHPHPRKQTWAFERFRKAYLRFLGRRVAGFLACGKLTADHLRALGIAPEKITNFPYWVEIPANWSLPRKCEENREKDPVRLAGIGRHVPVKAFEVAIEAVALANQKAGRKIATLDLIGEGPERPRLEALAKSLGLQDVVTFSGWLENREVWQRLRDADALVVPSRFEPYGVVVLEALANGRPVLASDRVIAALDRDDGLGAIFFHPAGDSECLAQQIKALADKNVLRKSAQAARAIAEKWRPERAASILSSVFDKSHPGRASDERKRLVATL